MGDIGGIIGLIGLVCGLYVFYALYRMKSDGKIPASVLLPRDTNPEKCKDKKAYIREVTPRMAVLGASAVLYGAVDLYNSYVGEIAQVLFWAVLILVLAVLVWFGITVKKINQKYY